MDNGCSQVGMDSMGELLDLFGQAQNISAAEMALRASIVYVCALAIVRLGDKRFLGKPTAFDAVIAIIFGSVVSRAITGNAPLWPALLAGLVLVLLHSTFGALALHSHRFGVLIKGQPRLLVRDGVVDAAEMRRTRMSEEDLKEAFRLASGTEDVTQAAAARLERSGQLSVIKSPTEPKVLGVEVAGAVATIRIQLRSP
jgi:uncharacterized membrane protein YcaP (DUF421 family)